jgi:dTDP-4-dehydrorhamnose 3,5-epimerase
MAWKSTSFKGVWLFEPSVWKDDRGYFFESFNEKKLPTELDKILFVQDNESMSSFGVVRGLHYQLPMFMQAKLVRCTIGQVIDVIVDLRPSSKTYGSAESFILDEDNKHQLFIPHGFAHGFGVLSDRAIFAYKCDNYFSKESEGGIFPLDTNLCIDWQIPSDKMIISEKDLALPPLGNHRPIPDFLT